MPQEILPLIAALAIGTLIGLERGWRDRALPDGGRAAGLRTFTLTGLLAGVLASLPDPLNIWALITGLLTIGSYMGIAYWRGSVAGSQSITTAIALLLTYGLATYAVLEQPLIALGLSVIVALLLSLKETLHGWLRQIELVEIRAGLQLLVLSVVILPYLPDQHMGPYAALNPYKLWWAVILIAGLTMAGHIAIRIYGTHRGTLWTGLLGGLASSTATTLALARISRQNPEVEPPAVAGALSASAIMALRILFISWVMQPTLALHLAPVLVVGACILFMPIIWQAKIPAPAPATISVANDIQPYSLKTALGFGLFLAGVAILVPAAKTWLGSEGVYAVSMLSGIADVDAITISLAQLFGDGGVTVHMASIGISLAAMVNFIAKLAICVFAGTPTFARKVGLGYLAATVGSVLTLLVVL